MNPFISWWFMCGVAQASLLEMWEPWFQNNKEKDNG